MPEPATVPLPDLPARPTLRPGWYVVRRGDGLLQVGVDPPHRVVLADSLAVHAVLDALRALRRPGRRGRLDPAGAACLADLLAADLVVDADAPRLEALRFGASALPRTLARRAVRVRLLAPGHLRADAERLLAQAGLTTASDDAAEMALVLHQGEPVRETLDALVRDALPHLLVTASEARIEVGPFVVPGLTACLRCVDAHRGEADVRRALVLEQVSRLVRSEVPASTTRAAPSDPLLWSWALAWAARDLARYAEGDEPSTWSASHTIDPVAAPVGRRWARHPHCGCAWQPVASTG